MKNYGWNLLVLHWKYWKIIPNSTIGEIRIFYVKNTYFNPYRTRTRKSHVFLRKSHVFLRTKIRIFPVFGPFFHFEILGIVDPKLKVLTPKKWEFRCVWFPMKCLWCIRGPFTAGFLHGQLFFCCRRDRFKDQGKVNGMVKAVKEETAPPKKVPSKQWSCSELQQGHAKLLEIKTEKLSPDEMQKQIQEAYHKIMCRVFFGDLWVQPKQFHLYQIQHCWKDKDTQA